ncbi:hypothetical protein AB0E09_03445 [Streptomyces mirabilis]|nr:hypothetical protein [Streptomyces mirabilis]MCX4435898.1 hypothetical protein [Streptomyces mirabilis]
MKDEEILAYFDHRGRAELRTGRIGAPTADHCGSPRSAPAANTTPPAPAPTA